ncbi:MAG: hypothetical protein RR728_01790 [Oscillospiraceae bacterium]
MVKLAKKLGIVLLPIVIYFGIFIYFEPYNYFGIKQSEYTGDSAIVRVRSFNENKENAIILGDSRMAHFDMELAQGYAKKPISQLSFGGASFNESMDLFDYALEQNPNIDTVYFGVSFYTLNESYFKDRMSQIKTIATNPFAYMLNFNYNIEMLNEIVWKIRGIENVASDNEGHWTAADYQNEDGTVRKYRKDLEAFAQTIYGVCTAVPYKIDTPDVERYIKIAKLCKEKGIKLYTILPPMDNSLKDLVVDKLGIGGDILEFIAAVEPYSEVLNYEYNQENPFTQEQFYDGFHLDKVTGLPQFTKMLFERG